MIPVKTKKANRLKFFLAVLVLSLLAPAVITLAQVDCQTREECEALLKKYEEEITKYEGEIAKTQQEKNTLNSQISILKKKVGQLNAQINQGNLMIKDLGIQIGDTQESIGQTSLKIDDTREKLASIIRTINEEGQRSLFEILLSEPKLSDFFDNLTALEALTQKNQELLQSIKTLKTDLEEQEQQLDSQKESLEKTTRLQALQKEESLSTQKSQEQLLAVTKGKESTYQKMLQDAQKKAAEIRAKLFQVIGVSKVPTFGEALEVAKNVGSLVGIRPAFLLAVISQESAIGRNVGQCLLTDPATGAGKRISTGATLSRVMKPTRDVKPFLEITAALGRDPYATAVSCPLSYGYGGAMGPAQFIPSTWKLYADKISATLGRPGDPWAIMDSFTAAGLYLADLGATAQTAAKEALAASRYYGGSSSYASSVKTRANCIQTFMNAGTMSAYCENLIF